MGGVLLDVDEEVIELRSGTIAIKVVADDDRIAVLVDGLDVFSFVGLIAARDLAEEDDIEDVSGKGSILPDILGVVGEIFLEEELVHCRLGGKGVDVAIVGRRFRFLSFPLWRRESVLADLLVDENIGNGKGRHRHVAVIETIVVLRHGTGGEKKGGQEKEKSSFGHSSILNYLCSDL